MTGFFVPGAADGDDEAEYARLAAAAGREPAPSGRRVRQISFKVKNETWTAIVGEIPRGTRPEHSRRKGQLTTTILKLSDAATVRAIFAGETFAIVTDAEPGSDSRWPTPFTLPRASGVAYFPAD